jgi:hypothetical protein
MLTLLHVCLCTHGILIVNVTHPAPWQDFLPPHRIRWDIVNYPQCTLILDSTNKPPRDFLKDPRTNLRLAQHHQGIQMKTNLWMGTPHHGYAQYDQCMRQSVDDTFTDWNNTQARKMYRWGIWTLFRSHDSVLEHARQLKVQSGLSEKIMANGNDHHTSVLHAPHLPITYRWHHHHHPYVAIHIRTGRVFRSGKDNTRHTGNETFRQFWECGQRFRQAIEARRQNEQGKKLSFRNVTRTDDDHPTPRKTYLASDSNHVKRILQQWDPSIVIGKKKIVSYHMNRSKPNLSPNLTQCERAQRIKGSSTRRAKTKLVVG